MSRDNQQVASGYSGQGVGRNDPTAQNMRNVGPVPTGSYTIGTAHQSSNTGPMTMNLMPQAGTNTYGRSAFRIHGDNAAHNASHGCIILNHAARVRISSSQDRVLIVVP
ncbi:MAG: DUF2778 domain-containing protein [Burkholderiales bacterium]|nr:L,D-transpeptidase [Burkholderiales bacterium]MDE1927420.1 DUF2778 domain-containing protein [Burkholderiales bacterium]MDE2160312.1 DUF2778 domain-containing protein [Burkholderiales bacterium]MDE2504782.1 DUF2778 domain-containing protein [Burkholderiales bacterium]